ncbi:MAG: cobalt-precorrin 5A hydrolase [Clostridium sp.]
MKIGIISHSYDGMRLSCRLMDLLRSKGYKVDIFTTKKNMKENITSTSLKEFSEALFKEYRFGIYIGSCSIAVRGIAPFVKDKKTDPGVIVIDDLGGHVIPILSGHIGGANSLAKVIGECINSNVVITTGSDIRGIIPVDEFAVRNNLHIDDLNKAKYIASRIIDGFSVGLISEENIVSKVPHEYSLSSGDYGVYIGSKLLSPFKNTLNLIPRNLVIGIGCRRGVEKYRIYEFLLDLLKENNLSIHGLKVINSIDIKKDEKGIIEVSSMLNLPFNTYSADTLNNVQGKFASSGFVKSITGVDNVCERAALIHGGEILVHKSCRDGITLSIVRLKGGVSFEY